MWESVLRHCAYTNVWIDMIPCKIATDPVVGLLVIILTVNAVFYTARMLTKEG